MTTKNYMRNLQTGWGWGQVGGMSVCGSGGCGSDVCGCVGVGVWVCGCDLKVYLHVGPISH